MSTIADCGLERVKNNVIYNILTFSATALQTLWTISGKILFSYTKNSHTSLLGYTVNVQGLPYYNILTSEIGLGKPRQQILC